MSKQQVKKRNQLKLARLPIVSELYLRGYSIRRIQAEVIKKLGLESYSTSTVKQDIDTLLKEWQDTRIQNTERAVLVEVEKTYRIEEELWQEWHRSQVDITKKVSKNKRKGIPVANSSTGDSVMKTILKEETAENTTSLGDVRYLTEIRHQQAERRKLLGLYAPEKRELQNTLSFLDFLKKTDTENERDGQHSRTKN